MAASRQAGRQAGRQEESRSLAEAWTKRALGV